MTKSTGEKVTDICETVENKEELLNILSLRFPPTTYQDLVITLWDGRKIRMERMDVILSTERYLSIERVKSEKKAISKYLIVPAMKSLLLSGEEFLLLYEGRKFKFKIHITIS